MSTSLQCTICNASSSKQCARCQSTAYCSPECQQTDWSTHRRLCKAFSLFPPAFPPSHTHGIQFPTTGKPRLIWIPVKRKSITGTHDHTQVDEFLEYYPNKASDPYDKTYHMIRGNTLRSPDQNDHVIQLVGRPNGCVNQSIAAVGGTRWEAWSGPWVAVALAGTDPDPSSTQDISMADFSDVVDFFSYYHELNGSATNGAVDEFTKQVQKTIGGKVRGLRVNCRGDRVVHKRELMEEVDVPLRHPVFDLGNGDRSVVSEMLNKTSDASPPMSMWSYAQSGAWKDDKVGPQNTVADALFVDIGPESETWGKSKWEVGGQDGSRGSGSILLVDYRKKTLYVDDVKRIFLYLCWQVLPKMLEVKEEEGRKEFCETVQEELLWDCFEDDTDLDKIIDDLKVNLSGWNT